MQPEEGRNRVIIEAVTPEIDGGRFPIKRIVGDETVVEADILADGHEALSCALLHRKEGDQNNAAYWYSRAGKAVCREPLDAEWINIVRQLLNRCSISNPEDSVSE